MGPKTQVERGNVFRVTGSGLKVRGFGMQVAGCRVQCFGFRGYGVQGPENLVGVSVCACARSNRARMLACSRMPPSSPDMPLAVEVRSSALSRWSTSLALADNQASSCLEAFADFVTVAFSSETCPGTLARAAEVAPRPSPPPPSLRGAGMQRDARWV